MRFNPHEFIRLMVSIGFNMTADGQYLFVEPASKLTDEMLAVIRKHKRELMPLLPPEGTA